MAYQKKEEILSEIVAIQGEEDESLKEKSRDELVEILDKLRLANSLADLEPIAEETDDPVEEKEEASEDEEPIIPPEITDPEWTEYVMGQFVEEELYDGKPTCDGLRRVFQLLIGEIINTEIEVIRAPSRDDGGAVVGCTITYKGKEDSRWGGEKKVTDVIDVSKENTKYPWHLAAVGTAATKAEARALRKRLGIRKLSTEEVDQGFDQDNEEVKEDPKTANISDGLKTAIRNLSTRLNINIEKLLTHMEYPTSMDDLTIQQGQIVVRNLNEYSMDQSKIPTEIVSEMDVIVA